MNWAYYWPFLLMLAGILLSILVQIFRQFKASAWAQKHTAIARIADIADDICSAGLAYLTNNPTASAKDVAAWAVSELKASAPDLITAAGDAASHASMSYMINRKLVTAAQAAPITAATSKIIAELVPSITTARVTPAQTAAVLGTATAAAPDVEAIATALLAKFPGLKILQSSNVPPAVVQSLTTTVASADNAQPSN